MLLIGDRVVLRANAPPEAEYLMFEIGDIELRSNEPGRVREHGYQTTVGRARARLAQGGFTPAHARECAAAMQPTLSTAYARGPVARHVARYLGALELLEADHYDANAHAYRGVFIDLPTLVADLETPHAGAVLQGLHLAMLLEQEADDTRVFLSTDAWTKLLKPGERTHKRPKTAAVREVCTSLGRLAELDPHPEVHEHLPRADVLAFLRSRAESEGDEDARALFRSLERAINVREIPDRGPLAEAELWDIEIRLETGNLDGILDAVEEVERARGRTPGTTYLRARASLVLRLEPPKLIAERVSALALSMTSFGELSLLAAEAWLEAGDPGRAMPYARDLVDDPGVDDGLRVRAQRLLARAVGAAPERHLTQTDSAAASPLPAKRPSMPPVSVPDPNVPKSWPPQRSRVPTERNAGATATSLTPPPSHPTAPPSSRSGGLDMPSSRPPLAPPPRRRSPGAEVVSSAPPPPHSAAAVTLARPSSEPPPPPIPSMPAPIPSMPAPIPSMPAPSPSMAPPIPSMAPPIRSMPAPIPSMPPSGDAGRDARKASPRPALRGMGIVRLESRAPPGFDPRAEPEHDEPPVSAPSRAPGGRAAPDSGGAKETLKGATLPRPARSSAQPSPLPPIRPPPPPRVDVDLTLHGATLPPYRLEDPPPLLPKAPLLPKLGGDELAEHLSLPSGLVENARIDILPRSVLEARVTFTLLARELGLDYRRKRGIELRADLSGIEAMQAVLLERFPKNVILTHQDAYELRRHGALLSEILARHLDAEWVDISPSEPGHWSMIVPRETRVWPFGRVARLVEMGHRERDLVSYFLELQGRARGR